MSAGRARRIPISCEPCRVRKIRCPRDSLPCGTCRRRGISPDACRYADSSSLPRWAAQPSAAVSLSPCSYHTSQLVGSSHTHDLAERVQKLEQLLSSRSGDGASGSTSGYTHGNAIITSYDGQGPVTGGDLPILNASLRGSLRTTDAGHMRFVPDALSWNPGASNHDDIATETSITTLSINHPLSSGETASIKELLAALPSERMCQKLITTYFASFASLFHILHDPTFLTQYGYFLKDPQSMPLSWLALLYSVLSTAILALPPDSPVLSDLSWQKSPLERSAELTQRYRNMTMRCLEADHYLWNHNVTTLQALVILIYGINHSHGQTWTLIGLTYHLALSIGCHVDPQTLDLGAVEIEERRRAWAGLMMLYTNQNTALGHIGSPQLALHATCKSPSDVDDEDIGTESRSTHVPKKATQMTYLLLKFRLYDLCADICTQVLCRPTLNLDVVRKLDIALQSERHSWETRLLEAMDSTQSPSHHFAHLNVLYNYVNHLTLLLHQRQALDPQYDKGTAQWARQRCLESAKHLLEVHATLNEAPDLAPFRWYGRGLGSFYAFHAAVFLAHLLQVGFVKDNADALNILQRCVCRFESLAQYSAMCAKALPILQALAQHLPAGASRPRVEIGAKHLEHSHATPPLQQWQQNLPEDYGQIPDHAQDPACSDLDALLWQYPPQQWLTPASLPWAEWADAVQHNTTSTFG